MFTRQGPVPQKGGYSVLLCAPDEYWDASPNEKAALCNGCGSKHTGWFPVRAPETMYGVDIKDACDIHDVCYHVGVTLEDKDQADREFLNNLIRLIDYAPSAGWKLLGPILSSLRHRRAIKYYEAVQFLGGPAYWAGKT